VLKEFLVLFLRESEKFNNVLAAAIKQMTEDRDALERNFRTDLTSDAFFYGRVQNSMKLRGVQIAEMAQAIKKTYIDPINSLKGKIEKYDQKINDAIDPNKSLENFMKALPTSDEFGSLTKFAEKKPDKQVEAMKAAYAVAIKGVEYLGKIIINVIDMEERGRLQKQLGELTAAYDKFNRNYETVIYEYDAVKNLVVILDGMKFFSDSAVEIIGVLRKALAELSESRKSGDVVLYHKTILELEKFFGKYWQM
jgi:DNA repair exonuclease SbcCD ATPase subunit